jgi:hypothetical protein
MKAGRPAYHVRSKWVTIATPHGLLYFELDRRGNLIRLNKQLLVHHVEPLCIPETPAAPISAPDPAPVLPLPIVTSDLFDTSNWMQYDTLTGGVSTDDSPDTILGFMESWE